MLDVFTNAWKVTDIRKKMFFIMFALLVYRIGSHIPLPGIDLNLLSQIKGVSSDQVNIYAIIAGGGYGSLFVLGIGPFITSSIIMQLLTVAIPKLEQIQKEGEEGRKKINQYTRIVAVALAFLQASGTVYSYCYTAVGNLFIYHNFFVYIMVTCAMVTGTMFIMWLSEYLTEKGIGNGSSFIIFANILSGLPSGVANLYLQATSQGIWGIVKVLLVVAIFAVVIAFVVFVQAGERRVPVQYSRKMVGRQTYGNNQTSYIPLKVNIAGVMSIIFAISLLQFPQTIYQFFRTDVLQAIVDILSINSPVGAVLYIVLIFFFTFFYTSFAINPIEMAENLKKNGGFIPGIRPGRPTSDFIQKSINRLSLIGAIFYAVIALVPVLFQAFLGMPVGFGGTTLLIVTGVALEFIKQLESQLLMRHYKGFLS